MFNRRIFPILTALGALIGLSARTHVNVRRDEPTPRVRQDSGRGFGRLRRRGKRVAQRFSYSAWRNRRNKLARLSRRVNRRKAKGL